MKYRERIKLERESSPEKKRGRKGERMVIFRIIDSLLKWKIIKSKPV